MFFMRNNPKIFALDPGAATKMSVTEAEKSDTSDVTKEQDIKS